MIGSHLAFALIAFSFTGRIQYTSAVLSLSISMACAAYVNVNFESHKIVSESSGVSLICSRMRCLGGCRCEIVISYISGQIMIHIVVVRTDRQFAHRLELAYQTSFLHLNLFGPTITLTKQYPERMATDPSIVDPGFTLQTLIRPTLYAPIVGSPNVINLPLGHASRFVNILDQRSLTKSPTAVSILFHWLESGFTLPLGTYNILE